MFADELKKKLTETENRISNLEGQVNPLLQALSALRDYRQHVVALLEREGGGTLGKQHNTEVMVPRKPNGEPYWQAICDDHGWPVNRNSAHRVVMGRDSALHVRIRHNCPENYDNRAYP